MSIRWTYDEAKRERVPLLLGIVGPSGSGKTYSMLRLLTGIQRVVGGDIAVIDTEANRAKHYADTFKFHHVPMGPPFNPLSYLEALRFATSKGATCIGVDSMSHEHEGEGGVLAMHETELDRMAGDDYAKRKRCSAGAWIKPKAERRQLVNGILQLGGNMVFCYRAQEKLDWKHKTDKGEPVELGWQPIAGPALVYEMTARCLLLPGSDGVPDWNPPVAAEKALVKKPQQFRELFDRFKGQPLSEDMGEEMARWAAGGVREDITAQVAAVASRAELDALWAMLGESERKRMKATFGARAKGLAGE